MARFNKLNFILGFFLILVFANSSYAQNKLDLDDLDIKGELLGDDRIQLINRQQNILKNHVKFRTNFREEIMEELEKPMPKYIYKN